MNKKIKISPETFAYAVIHEYQAKADTFEAISKEYLTLFLNAYLLIEQYDQLEENVFNSVDKSEFEKRLSEIKFFPNEPK